MDFDLTRFEFISQEPYIKHNNRTFFKLREKKNSSKIFTFLIIDGVSEDNLMKIHIHCQGRTDGIVKIKGHKNMDFLDQFGIKVCRQGYLLEEISLSLYQVAQVEKINETLIQQLLLDVVTILADLQEEEIALPYITPDQIMRMKDGKFKLFDVNHAISVIGMDSSIQREIKSDINYMDPDTFAASISGQISTLQNYFKSVIYSFGLIILEFNCQQFSNHRKTEEQIAFMLEQLSLVSPNLSDLVNQMVQSSKNKRPNCKEVYDYLLEIKKKIENKVDNQIGQDNIQQQDNTFNWTRQFTISQPINENFCSQEQFGETNKQVQGQQAQKFQDSLVYSDNCQTIQFVQSGIKLPENLRNQIKQWQERQQQVQSQQDFTWKQDEPSNHLESSDEIEQNFYNQMAFAQLLEILNRFPLIKQINESDLIINDEYNIDEQQNIFRCTFQNQEKVVKIYRNKPASYIFQLLNNINHIQKLKIHGLCIYEGYCLQESENGPFLGTLYLITQLMNCDLERALAIPQIQLKKQKEQVILNISLFLKAYNEHFTHGNLKPSNILLDNQLNIYVTDYGLSEVKGELDDQLYSSKPLCVYSPPEKTLKNTLSNTSDVWSFGIIISDILTGQKMSNSIIQKLGMKDHSQQGHLQIDKLDFFTSTEQNNKMKNLLKQMTQFNFQKRITSDQVYNELKIIFSWTDQSNFKSNNNNYCYAGNKISQSNIQKNNYVQPQPQLYSVNQNQQSPSFTSIKQTIQTNQNKIQRNTGLSHKIPPPSARQQRFEKSGGEFYIQGKTVNLQPQDGGKQKKTQ
ncbi:unnamed protein product [Paramecium primaurelia]|uniref:Protein kinase domain-containing protein n=1 Tax=Paramecium primaurelia TaxID=5886 RepID=A0A8S1JQK2_PARPR|nr:unnamed protein product [Paramecium primaurelia]